MVRTGPTAGVVQRAAGADGRRASDGRVTLVDRAVLNASRDRVGLDRLGDLHTLIGEGLRARTVAEQVGAHGGVDRCHDIGVERDGEVDGCGTIDGKIDIGREVEDRDDFLVRQRSDTLAGQFLGGSGVRALRYSWFSLLIARTMASRADAVR